MARPPVNSWHIDSMAAPAKTQLDAVVDESLSPHPLADPRFVEDVYSALLQHARPDAAPTYSRLRVSITTDSTPCNHNRRPSSNPAGPAPIIPTCVRGLPLKRFSHE